MKGKRLLPGLLLLGSLSVGSCSGVVELTPDAALDDNAGEETENPDGFLSDAGGETDLGNGQTEEEWLAVDEHDNSETEDGGVSDSDDESSGPEDGGFLDGGESLDFDEIPNWVVPPHNLTRTPPPLIYIMNDYENCDPKTMMGRFGTTCWGLDPATLPPGEYPFGFFGSHLRPSWDQIHAGNNQFNWGVIDQFLDAACQQQVTLTDGTAKNKPLLLTVAIYSRSCGAGEYCDHSPSWVPHQTIGYAGCSNVAIPAYADLQWQNAYFQFLQALGLRYDGHPCLGGLLLASGIDDESSPIKNNGNCKYADTFANQGSWGVYLEFLLESIRRAGQSFTQTPVYIQNAACTTQYGCRDGTTLEAVSQGIGVKLNGAAAPDIGYCWYHGMSPWGIMEILDRYVGQISRGLEPKTQSPGLAGTYWMFLAALAHHVDVLDVQKSHLLALDQLSDPADFRFFASNYFHRSAENAPGVWIALREHTPSDVPSYICPLHSPDPNFYGCFPNDQVDGQCWGSDYYGDMRFFLVRVDGSGSMTRVVEQSELPAQAQAQPYGQYQTRATNQAAGSRKMSFQIDPQWWGRSMSYFRVRLIYLDAGTDTLSFVYPDAAGVVQSHRLTKTDSKKFVIQDFEINHVRFNGSFEGATDFYIDSNADGDEIVHLVRIETTWALHQP